MAYLQTLNGKAEIKRTTLIFLFGSITIVFWCPECLLTWDGIYSERYSFLFNGLMWVLLWQGNGHLSDYISSKLSWLEQPSKRFIWGIIGVVIYSPLAVYLLYNITLFPYTTLFRSRKSVV